MRNSKKQNTWSQDIKTRLKILLNGYIERCGNPLEADNKKIITKVESIINNGNTNFIIDEYKSITDEAVVKMFDMPNSKYCKVFNMMFNGEKTIYQYQEKQRKEIQNKFLNLKAKYCKELYNLGIYQLYFLFSIF